MFRVWLLPNVLIQGYDFPSFPESLLIGGTLGWPHLWNDMQFGFSEAFWSECTPLWTLTAPLHAMGASFGLIERIYWLWPFMFGAPLCGYYLCYRFTRNPLAAGAAASLFAVNTFTVGLVERGHIPSLDAFVLFGFVLPGIVDFTGRPATRRALILALLISLQAMYDLRYAYESVFILGIVTALALPRLRRTGMAGTLLIALGSFGAALALLNLDFLLPLLVASRPPQGFGSATSFMAASHFGSLVSSLGLYYPWYHYLFGTDPFTVSTVEWPFLAVALLAWAGFLATSRRRSSRILAVVALASIALSSETRSPFGFLNVALYLHVPGFVLFRDLTKFDALTASAYAVGIALALTGAAAYLRRKGGSFARLGPLAACAFFLAYPFVMRDSLNPLRGSNFAAASDIGATLQATNDYLRARVTDERVLMFPGDLLWQKREPFMHTADASLTSGAFPPISGAGYGLLNPTLLAPGAMFGFFESPLAPELLSELRVKYVVVPDDPNLYFAFDGRPARWASVDFLRQQRWMHEVADFGSNAVFELNEPPVERAFFAPYPTEVIGSPATLEGLVGSPLWSNHAAALLYDQMPAHADWLTSLPNAVQGATLLDPNFPLGPGGTIAASQRLREAVAGERYRRRAFSAKVFSSAMLSITYGLWNLDSPFAFRFDTTQPGASRVSLLMEPRKLVPSVLTRTSGDVYSSGPVAGAGSQGAVVCRQDREWKGEFDGASSGSVTLSADDSLRELTIDNPCPVAYEGDVSLRVGADTPARVSVAYNSVTRNFYAMPGWLGPFGAGKVTIPDVLLQPGLNVLEVSKAVDRPVYVDAAYAVSNLREAPDAPADIRPLQLALKHSQSGNLIYASTDDPQTGPHVGYIDFFGPLALPLDRHPLCTLKFAMSDVPATFDLVLNLRDRSTGQVESMWIPVASRQDGDWDLYALVQDVERERAENEALYHADDPLWNYEHNPSGGRRADEFTLLGVRLATVWPILKSTELPHGAYVGLIAGERLALGERNVGSQWAIAQSDVLPTHGVTESSFALRGMKLLRVETTDGPDSRISAQLVGFTPPDYRLAASLHVGDYVELALANDKRVKGTIVAESSDYVVIEDGDNAPERIGRGSISSITAQTITRSAKLHIPISTQAAPTALSFSIRNDAALRVRIGLDYEGADGSSETYSAVDNEASDDARIDLEPRFVHPDLDAGTTVFDLSVPIDLSLTQAPSVRSEGYNIDLWSIERYRFGSAKHRLTGLDIEFTQPPDAATTSEQFSVTIANLTASNDRFVAGDEGRFAVGPALLRLDGTPVNLRSVTQVPGSAVYFSGGAELGSLGAGNHVIGSVRLDQIRVRAATLSRGAPERFYGGRVDGIEYQTPSEAVGSFDGAGLLVVPRTYDVGWTLALWGPGSTPPPLTGFALFDWIRCAGHVVPAADHVPVNTNIDAWYIAPGTSGERRFTMLYVPEALNELGFLVALLACCAYAFGTGLRWRRQT